MAQGLAGSPLPGQEDHGKRCSSIPRLDRASWCSRARSSCSGRDSRSRWRLIVQVDRNGLAPWLRIQLQPSGSWQARGPDRAWPTSSSKPELRGRSRGTPLRASSTRASFRSLRRREIRSKITQATAGQSARSACRRLRKQPRRFDHFDPGGGGKTGAQAAHPCSQPGFQPLSFSLQARRWAAAWKPAAWLQQAGSCACPLTLEPAPAKARGNPCCLPASGGACQQQAFPPEVSLA